MRLTGTVRQALALLTPVDASVFACLGDDERERHARDLAKRLIVAGELAAPGTGGRAARRLLAREEAPADLDARLDAVLELGTDRATPPDSDGVSSTGGEVRDEILHFDRIMDLEALDGGRRLKRRRDFVQEAGALGAVERLLTLLHERRVARGDDEGAWFDLACHPAGAVRSAHGFATLTRSAAPRITAAGRGAGAADALRELEAAALRHPLGVAVALLDYARFLAGAGPLDLVAAAMGRSFSRTWCDVWAAVPAHYLVVGRDGFRQVVRTAGTLEGRCLGRLGSCYGHVRLDVAEGEWLVLVPAPAAGLGQLTERLNVANRAGKVFLHEALGAAFPGSPAVVLRGDRRQARPGLDDDRRFVDAYVERVAASASRPLHVSLEAGHVHSDRAAGPVQLRGMALGALLRQRLLYQLEPAGLRLEVTPMVDDDHVVNRLSYAGYRAMLARQQLPLDDLVLESSPIVSAIAVDVLKRALTGAGDRFTCGRLGQNLYLTAPELRLELVQDAGSDAYRLGCILFDTALGIYRSDRATFNALFFAERGVAPFDVHQAMASSYDRHPHPGDRELVRARFDRLWRVPWAELVAQVEVTPYLDRYRHLVRSRSAAGESTVILNVLESYYEPLERKVLRLASLLELAMPLDAIHFAPHGLGLWTLGGFDAAAVAS